MALDAHVFVTVCSVCIEIYEGLTQITPHSQLTFSEANLERLENVLIIV